MCLIKVRGDSMVPTLQPADIVLVDHSRNYIDAQGGLYAITREMGPGESGIIVKRLQVLTEKIRIISDNPIYPLEEVSPDNIIINGKVLWFGRELER